MNQTTALVIAVIILFTLCIFLLFWAIKTEARLKKLFLGKKAESLEKTFSLVIDDITNLKKTQDAESKSILSIQNRLKKTIGKVKMLRFNPFQEAGSNQSFAVSFLDDEGDGIIMSSLYSRERMSIFAKPIKNNTSEFELTKEEQSVLK